MKKIYIWIAAALFACNSQTSKEKTPDSTDISKTADTPKQADAHPIQAATSAGPVDTFVWVGIHARWNYSQGVEYDGNYDTVHKVFVICSSDKHAIVPRDQVVLESSGTCDTAFSNRVRIMLFRRDTNFVKTIGKASSAEISRTGSPTLSFSTQQGSRTILLKQAEAARIRQTFYLRERVLIRPEQVKHPN